MSNGALLDGTKETVRLLSCGGRGSRRLIVFQWWYWIVWFKKIKNTLGQYLIVWLKKKKKNHTLGQYLIVWVKNKTKKLSDNISYRVGKKINTLGQ